MHATPPAPPPFGDRDAPSHLAARVSRSLHEAGLIERSTTRWRRAITLSAVLLLTSSGAFMIGRMHAASPPAGPEFLLLLYEDETYRDERPIGDIIAEYGRWADSLHAAGILVRAARLTEPAVDLHTTQSSQVSLPHAAEARTIPTGMFVIRSPDFLQARRIAASSPHLRHGGRVAVHAIAPTDR